MRPTSRNGILARAAMILGIVAAFGIIEVSDRGDPPSLQVTTADQPAATEAVAPSADRLAPLPTATVDPVSATPTAAEPPVAGEDDGQTEHEPAEDVAATSISPAVTPAAIAPTVVVSSPLFVGSYYPWPVELWPVVGCLIGYESEGDPLAVGGEGERGLLQIHPVNAGLVAALGYSWDDMFLAGPNLDVGLALYESGGLAPWHGRCG